MAETLVLGLPEVGAVPPSAEVLGAMAADPRVPAVGGTAVEQLMATEPEAVFEWPTGKTGNRGVTYTAPSGDS